MEYIKLVTNLMQTQIIVFFLNKGNMEKFNKVIQNFSKIQIQNLLVICFDFESKHFLEDMGIKNFTILNNKSVKNTTDYIFFTLYKISEASKKDIIYFDLDYGIFDNELLFLKNNQYFNTVFFSDNNKIDILIKKERLFSNNDIKNPSFLNLSPKIVKIKYSFETIYLFQEIFNIDILDWNKSNNIVEKYLLQNKILITKSHDKDIQYEILLKNKQIIGIINKANKKFDSKINGNSIKEKNEK